MVEIDTDAKIGSGAGKWIGICIGIDIIQVPRFLVNCFQLQDTKLNSSDHCVNQKEQRSFIDAHHCAQYFVCQSLFNNSMDHYSCFADDSIWADQV